MTEPSDIIQKQDEIAKKLIMEIPKAERISKRMHNELELEQAKGQLVVSELKREMLKVEELVRESMSNETNRLKTLMVNQLIEINKQEVLANIQRELMRLLGTFLEDLPESTSKSNELKKEEEIVEIPSPKADFQSADFQSATIEGDIQRIEREIAQGEKEQINVKQCLVRHQELLGEFKLLEEFTNRNEPTVPEIYGRGTQNLEVQLLKPQFKHDAENYELVDSSNFNRNSTGGTNTMSVIATGQGEDAIQDAEIEKGTRYGPYNAAGKNSAFVLKTAKRMNRIGPSCDSSKRTKLDLYDVSEKTSKDIVDCKRDEGLKKIAPMFKLKTPSRLARRIVDETQ